MSTNTALDQIKARAEKFADLCPDYMYRAIRHLERNCDVECEAAEEDENHVCNHPDRYEGEDMAKVLAAAPKLLAALEAVEAVLDARAAQQRAWMNSAPEGSPACYDAASRLVEIQRTASAIHEAITEALR